MRLTGQGIWGSPKDRKAALPVLRRAVELDVNFIDTADSYGPHVSEELIAEALLPYPKDFGIATKGGWNRITSTTSSTASSGHSPSSGSSPSNAALRETRFGYRET
jgi:aryl-alcohol dehydrogenase-like predicted oxidoreductase